MLIKVNEATPLQLSWLVAKCEGVTEHNMGKWKLPILEACTSYQYNPSNNWAQGGPIIEREWESLINQLYMEHGDCWTAYMHKGGCTTLVAFMFCYVASKLGDKVEVPDELK